MPSATPPVRPALELRDVSKYFGDLAAVNTVRLRIEPGDSVLLYGPNGAGKTTLLRMLAMLVRPTEGHVFHNGQDVHANLVAAKSAIGFVSHSTFLYGELTARENLKFTGRLFGLSQLPQRIAAVLELFHLQDHADVHVRDLSRGYQQRVSLARAFLHDPTFLLLDEPFTGLDAASTGILQDLLRRLPEQGKALVFSTHDFAQGAAIARRLVALERGRVHYDGPFELAPLQGLGIRARKADVPG